MVTIAWINSITVIEYLSPVQIKKKYESVSYQIVINFLGVSNLIRQTSFLSWQSYRRFIYIHDSINKHQCCSIEHIMLCHRSWCPFERQGNSLPEWDDCDSNDHVGATATTTTTSTAATSKLINLQVNLDGNNKQFIQWCYATIAKKSMFMAPRRYSRSVEHGNSPCYNGYFTEVYCNYQQKSLLRNEKKHIPRTKHHLVF